MTASGQIKPPEDKRLWEQMKKGDDEALATLFKRYYALLYDYGIKISHRQELVKDCIQDLFAYVWKKRSTLSMADSVPAYLIVSLRRLLLKSIERFDQKETVYQEFSQYQFDNAFSSEDILIRNEEIDAVKKVLQQAINKIPTRMREALYLKTYSELSYKEIAVIMQINSQVARNYVSEAFRRLRVIFTEQSNVY